MGMSTPAMVPLANRSAPAGALQDQHPPGRPQPAVYSSTGQPGSRPARGLAGGIRTQYQHLTEVFPTLDELRGVEVPTSRQHGWLLRFGRLGFVGAEFRTTSVVYSPLGWLRGPSPRRRKGIPAA